MFKTFRPGTLNETLEILNNNNCHIFAGGTDLMIRKRQWQGAERKFTQPVCYINHLDELKGISIYENRFEIGSLTTQTDIVESNLPDYIKYPYSLMSHPAIRNIATVGGNIVNAASVADSLPILYALDAVLELSSVGGVREISVSDFILDKYKTVRNSNELLTKVIIPKLPINDFYYIKLGQRKASILSKLSLFIVQGDDLFRLGIGAVNDTVIRDESLEKTYLRNHNIEDLLRGYKALMKSKDDKRSTKKYREQVTLDIIKNYLKGDIHGL